mgnify:CR=1 FL=1
MKLIKLWTIGLCLGVMLACTNSYADMHEDGLKPTPNVPTIPSEPVPEVSPLVPEVPPVPQVPQQQKSPIAKWPGLFDCGPTGVILGLVKGKYSEIEFILSNGMVQLPDGRILAAPMLIYLNPQTKTFSIVAHFPNAISCIITSGKDMQPAPRDPNQQAPGQGPGLKPGSGGKPYLEVEKFKRYQIHDDGHINLPLLALQ